MFTRDVSDIGYRHTCDGAPPPLHVADSQMAMARWWPLPRPDLAPQHPGPIHVNLPWPQGAALGDDPTDPAAQTLPRASTTGMIGRLNIQVAGRSVTEAGVRL